MTENARADEFLEVSIAELHQAYLSGRVSPVDITRATLARIQADNRFGAFVATDAETASAAAERSATRFENGAHRGLLDGVPMSVKDIIAVDGMQWEAGSAVLRGHRATEDAPVVRQLRQAGAVIVGKTALDEFALTTTGPVRNPVDESLTAGGSSCGSAVAVRRGLSFADIATDTGGSVRIPAHCCQVAGLKPTRSLLPLDGVVPLAHTLDHVGILARHAADTAIVLDALVPGIDLIADEGLPRPEQITIGVPTNLRFFGHHAEARFQESVAALEHAGMRRVDVELPDLDRVAEIHSVVLLSEMTSYHGMRFGSEEARYGPGLHDFLWNAETDQTRRRYLQAQSQRAQITRDIDAQLSGCDVLVLPTLLVDIPGATQYEIDLDGAPTFATTAMVRLTSLFNHTGHPALVVSPNKLSTTDFRGVQLVGAPFADVFLTQVGRLCEVVLERDGRLLHAHAEDS
ncbi:amidase [Mycolicibacterium wolinskyi]|uniref:amidase n=1 Tax=Mycolicibacterium wolinskyi TaxID=59750 RepID=UPI003917B314